MIKRECVVPVDLPLKRSLYSTVKSESYIAMQIELSSKDLFLIKWWRCNSSPQTLLFINIKLGDFRRSIRNCLVSAVLSGLNSKVFLHNVSVNIISNIISVDILNNSVPWIPEAKFITFFFFFPQGSILIMQRYILLFLFFSVVRSEGGRYSYPLLFQSNNFHE